MNQNTAKTAESAHSRTLDAEKAAVRANPKHAAKKTPEQSVQKYAVKKAAALLKDYPLYRAALEYREDQEENGCFSQLDTDRRERLDRQSRVLRRKVRALEAGLELMTPLERKVVTELIIEGKTAEDVCEICSMERSTVYRYRASALRKLAMLFYGVDGR